MHMYIYICICICIYNKCNLLVVFQGDGGVLLSQNALLVHLQVRELVEIHHPESSTVLNSNINKLVLFLVFCHCGR